MTILVTSCMSSSVTATAVPFAVSPYSADTLIPTNTDSISLTHIAETEIAERLEPYQFSYSEDLSPLNRTLGEPVIRTLWFTQSARWWSSSDKSAAQEIVKLGMNPGLGIRELHVQGITGKGVTVAIIDQPMLLDHPEFQGKVVKYYDVGTNQVVSMHGPAVTSLLVGNNIGTAPDAKVYFVAVPSWLYDAQYYADALSWIVAENKELPVKDKVRVVSVSSIPSGIWTEYTKNTDAWDTAYRQATEAGILVLDCTYEHGYTVPCTYDLNDPDNVGKCIPNWGGPINSPHKRINIPTRRTTAEERVDEPTYSYQYTGIGGISWTVPYLSGVLAMGWQLNPDLTGSELLDMVYASAYVNDDGYLIINPQAFIDTVRLTVEK